MTGLRITDFWPLSPSFVCVQFGRLQYVLKEKKKSFKFIHLLNHLIPLVGVVGPLAQWVRGGEQP